MRKIGKKQIVIRCDQNRTVDTLKTGEISDIGISRYQITIEIISGKDFLQTLNSLTVFNR
ncbi:hypothetical protein JW979_10925 [bacterium]|nr:hypothetical protein [candidate division CSSED10-310 bacterium]